MNNRMKKLTSNSRSAAVTGWPGTPLLPSLTEAELGSHPTRSKDKIFVSFPEGDESRHATVAARECSSPKRRHRPTLTAT